MALAWLDTCWHGDTTARIKHLSYPFFKEFSTQIGICGRQCLPQVSVPLSNHVSLPAGLDYGSRVLGNVSRKLAWAQHSLSCPCGADPRRRWPRTEGTPSRREQEVPCWNSECAHGAPWAVPGATGPRLEAPFLPCHTLCSE